MPLDEEQTLTIRAVALLAAAHVFNNHLETSPSEVVDMAKSFEDYLKSDLPVPSP